MIKKAIVTGTWSKSWLAGDVKEVLKSIQELKEMYPHLNLANARVEFIELDDVDNEFEEVDGEEEWEKSLIFTKSLKKMY